MLCSKIPKSDEDADGRLSCQITSTPVLGTLCTAICGQGKVCPTHCRRIESEYVSGLNASNYQFSKPGAVQTATVQGLDDASVPSERYSLVSNAFAVRNTNQKKYSLLISQAYRTANGLVLLILSQIPLPARAETAVTADGMSTSGKVKRPGLKVRTAIGPSRLSMLPIRRSFRMR